MTKITIDTSSSKIGWALKKLNNEGNWETKSGLIDLTKIKTEEDKIDFIEDNIHEMLLYVREPIYVLFETPNRPYKGHKAFAKQKEYLGVFKAVFRMSRRKIYMSELSSIEWTSILMKQQPKLEKEDNKQWSKRLAQKEDDNEADAVNMLSIFNEIWNKANDKKISKLKTKKDKENYNNRKIYLKDE